MPSPKTPPVWWPIAATAVLTVPLPAQQTAEWIYHKTADSQHPDGQEQQLVWLMNRARANPTAEGQFLASSGDPEIEFSLNYFNVNRTRLQQEFAAIAPAPPAAFDRRIYEASLEHSRDLIARDAMDHTGQPERLRQHFSYETARMSVFSFAEYALHAHGALNVDWGGADGGMQAGRGHRAAIMSISQVPLTNVGFAMVRDRDDNTQVGPYVFSGAYCNASSAGTLHFDRFLVGTVWNDANKNNFYDAGEGVGNVRVQPNTGAWHAITSAGGGWAIPVAVPGTYTLNFSGPALPAGFSRQATVGESSLLVDTKVLPAFSLSITPGAGGTLLLQWSGGAAPWQVQKFTSPTAGWQNVGGPTQATSLSVQPTEGRAFYRVVSS